MKKIIFILGLVSWLFSSQTINMYSSPSCGCCNLWAEYMKNKGYQVVSHKDNNFMDIKNKYNIPPRFQSCHTAIIGNYVVEGHVPEDTIRWMLQNKPNDIIGISAPGMPHGSPGMEQGHEEEYPIVLILKDGSHRIYGIYKGHKLIKKAI